MNTSMFLPQVAEEDQYDANGHQIDDINSVAEFMCVQLGIDKTADDEDDDSGQNFHLVKDAEYFYQPQFICIEPAKYTQANEQKKFADYLIPKPNAVEVEITTPPPKVNIV